MTGRHKLNAIAIRPGDEARAWLGAEADRTAGGQVATVVAAAIAAYMRLPEGERDRLAAQAHADAQARKRAGRPARATRTTHEHGADKRGEDALEASSTTPVWVTES